MSENGDDGDYVYEDDDDYQYEDGADDYGFEEDEPPSEQKGEYVSHGANDEKGK